MREDTLRWSSDLITATEAGTLPGLFRRRCERSPEREAYRQFEGSGWRSHPWSEMSRLVARWQLAVADERLAPGDRVAVLLRNSVEWACFDQAAQSLGLVVVPLYTTDHPGNIAYLLEDSGARLLLVGDIQQWLAIRADQVRLPQLRHVLCMDAGEVPLPRDGARVSSVADWLPFAALPQANLARDPPLWELPVTEQPDRKTDPQAQPAPDYEFDQRVAW